MYVLLSEVTTPWKLPKNYCYIFDVNTLMLEVANLWQVFSIDATLGYQSSLHMLDLQGTRSLPVLLCEELSGLRRGTK